MSVKAARRVWTRLMAICILLILLPGSIAQNPVPNLLPSVHAMPIDPPATIAPSNKTWGTFFGTSGDVRIDVNRTGIAVRVEIPREFLQGVVSGENDTHFIQSNIRNDYYYYSVVDESLHWSYNQTSNGPCFKPRFSIRDPNAPWCVEIWNLLNGTFLTFTPPKFIRFQGLNAPSIAGIYNFTLFVADHKNSDPLLGDPACHNPAKLPPDFCSYPDFVHAWNTTLFVPVSMSDDPASITGTICDNGFAPLCAAHAITGTKSVVYAENSNGQIVARAFVNETIEAATLGRQFNLTGLAPGSYTILGSAGFNSAADVAYSLSTAPGPPVTVGYGDRTSISLPLNRAPQVCGQIDYQNPPGTPLAHPFSGHPYLPSTGLKALNITVEAADAQQHVYRNLTMSLDNGPDHFKLVIGSNVTYVGTDPYGTEFAGLPPSATLALNAWISGYVQTQVNPSPLTFSVTDPNGIPAGSDPCIRKPQVIMQVQPAISGTIQFWNQAGLETPHQAEVSLPVSPVTDALFGGNILIQAFDHLGILRAVSVINGTFPNGTTSYRDNTSIPFFLFGFNEYSNHTWSGTWNEHDNGLPADSSYSIQVYIRGYELNTTTSITIGQGCPPPNISPKCTTPAGDLKMLRGGAFQVGVFSFDNRPGTRAIQAVQNFLFLNLSIPVPARTYFYDSSGRLVGYVQCILSALNSTLGIPQPDRLCRLGTAGGGSVSSSFTVIFAGQNWSLREIWFYGDTPTHVRGDTYTIKTYTLGFVWQNGPTQSQNTLLGFAVVAVTLLIGDEIEITGPIFSNVQLLGTLPENEHVIGQVFGGITNGATPANVTAGTPTLRLPNFGFGGMAESNGTLEGQGHFFYVAPDGTRNFDYGLENTTYTAQVPEFGFTRHFMQYAPVAVITFTDLFLETGVVMSDIAMARVISGPLIIGWVDSTSDVVPLTWVQVTASNSTFQRSVPTLDGQFGGVSALHLPQGTYNITFSVAFYKPSNPSSIPPYQTVINLPVGWDAEIPVVPPGGPLCPTAASAATCDPPTSASLTPLSNLPHSNPALTVVQCSLTEAIPLASLSVVKNQMQAPN